MLRLDVVVQAGAMFFDYARVLPDRRGMYELSPIGAIRRQAIVAEACSPDAEPDAAADGEHR